MDIKFQMEKRARPLNSLCYKEGPVIYWLSRDQRAEDNWALLYAQHLALNNEGGIVVAFCLTPNFLDASMRHYSFMVEGLKEVEHELRKLNIPFYLLLGNPPEELAKLAVKLRAGAIVCDFDPLNIKRAWKQELIKNIKIPLIEVDAHNIIPCWLASGKQEFGAYTLRPKIKKLLPSFLVEFPKPIRQKAQNLPNNDWGEALDSLKVSGQKPVQIPPGSKAAKAKLDSFIGNKLGSYNLRNDPNADVVSGLSPYLHFGQISAQRVALQVLRAEAGILQKDSFLEELIVRKELADNFCYYNSNYDNFNGFPEWAKKTLDEHRKDKRKYLYSKDEFESAKTHDPLWNACQKEMLSKGKMHGYMRMYWAKKILEWTKSPEDALKIAIYLNDKYELDGRDPNGYTGIAWSIGGVHDRPWPERKIFGKIRYMSYNGCKLKFDVEKYIRGEHG